jgi:cholesterol transport system auxiliary component
MSSTSPHWALTRRRLIETVAFGAGGLALAGCSSVIGQQPPQLYVLTPKNTWDPDLPKVDWQLLVEVPVAPQSLDSARIVLSNSSTTLDYFADAAWVDRAPVMIQGLMVESFENTGKILAVGRDTSGLRADYILNLELRNFEARYANPASPPKVYVRMDAKLVKMPERVIIGNLNVAYESDAERNATDNIIGAFNDALGRTMKRIVQWTLRTGR